MRERVRKGEGEIGIQMRRGSILRSDSSERGVRDLDG